MRSRAGSGVAIGLAALPLAGCADAPMTYMRTFGPAADPVTSLGWGLTIICSAVVVIIGALVLAAVWRRADRAPPRDPHPGAIAGSRGGLAWIYVGVGISTAVLLGIVAWTMATLRAVAAPPHDPGFTIEVQAHQWWWEARYIGDPPSRSFTTANELHVPVGTPVRLLLKGDDVIHSFWVPALAGKTDVIPGQTNVAWIQADRSGVYRGQCTEYCGAQHAKMAMFVVADPPDAFHSWWDAQVAAAPTPSPGESARGQLVFAGRCAACHTVRGTDAGGILGPDLTHVMSRRTIAAGILANDAGSLAGWIADAQAVKPGSRMPALALSGPELAAVTAYVQTLH